MVHTLDHVFSQSPFDRDSYEDISTLQDLTKCALLGFHSMKFFVFIHSLRTAFVDYSIGIYHETLVRICSIRFD